MSVVVLVASICNSLHLSEGDEVGEAEAGPGHGVEEDEGDAAAGLQQQEDHQRDRGELQQLQQALFIETIPRQCIKYFCKCALNIFRGAIPRQLSSVSL